MDSFYFVTLVVFIFFVGFPVGANVNTSTIKRNTRSAEAGGVIEYVLQDKTRVDCLTEEHAIEFDFANHWAESIDQALYYVARNLVSC